MLDLDRIDPIAGSPPEMTVAFIRVSQKFGVLLSRILEPVSIGSQTFTCKKRGAAHKRAAPLL